MAAETERGPSWPCRGPRQRRLRSNTKTERSSFRSPPWDQQRGTIIIPPRIGFGEWRASGNFHLKQETGQGRKFRFFGNTGAAFPVSPATVAFVPVVRRVRNDATSQAAPKLITVAGIVAPPCTNGPASHRDTRRVSHAVLIDWLARFVLERRCCLCSISARRLSTTRLQRFAVGVARPSHSGRESWPADARGLAGSFIATGWLSSRPLLRNDAAGRSGAAARSSWNDSRRRHSTQAASRGRRQQRGRPHAASRGSVHVAGVR